MRDNIEGEDLEIVDSEQPFDLLNRQEIVDQIMQLINAISDNRGSFTFSLNGEWGSGKTFVLNMLEENLLTYQDGKKYLVFHYNCWEYDYYEEPLFAIIASLLEGIDEETHLLSKEARDAIKVGIETVKPYLLKIASAVSKANLGFDVTRVSQMVSDLKQRLENANDSPGPEREYDPYFSFNSTLRYIQRQFRELSQDYTVVLVVDELDRCMPAYAVKVLERLHHLFYGVKNCIVVLAVAKGQIDHTIKQVFGNETMVDQYLKKFIDFQMELGVGTIQGSFSQKYSEYFAMFDKTLIETEFDIDEFCAALFDSLDPRTQEHLMNRIKTAHKILIPEEKKDYSFLCFEMLWIVLLHNGLTNNMPILMERGKFCLTEKRSLTTSLDKFSEYIRKKWTNISMLPSTYWHGYIESNIFNNPIDIPQLMIWYLDDMYPNEVMEYQLDESTPRLEEYLRNREEIKRFDDLLNIIK